MQRTTVPGKPGPITGGVVQRRDSNSRADWLQFNVNPYCSTICPTPSPPLRKQDEQIVGTALTDSCQLPAAKPAQHVFFVLDGPERLSPKRNCHRNYPPPVRNGLFLHAFLPLSQWSRFWSYHYCTTTSTIPQFLHNKGEFW
jgi:hypothetical protein